MTTDSLRRALPGTAVAATIAAFPATDAAAQLVADAEFKEACEVLRLGGALDVPEWLAFSRTPSLQLDPTGRLYLNADASPAVTVLDPDGGFVRYVGGEGEGPGEFASVGGFGFVGDTVWLQHSFELHIAFFDSAGAHIRTEMDRGQPSSAPWSWRTSLPLARGYGFYIPPIGHADQANRDTGDERPRGLTITRAPEFKRVKLPMLVGIRSEATRDTLAFKYNFTRMHVEGIGTFGYQPIVVPPLLHIHPNGYGVVTADWEPDRPEEVTLRRYDLNGRVATEISIESRLRAVSADARNAFIDEGVETADRAAETARRMARQFGGPEVPTDLRAAVTEGLLLYDYFEPISAFFPTHDDRVWLRDSAPEEEYEALWVVLGPDGEPEFRVPAPTGITFKAALGDRVWATGVTELDVPYIVKYELRAPGACR